jgi:hypothetical protein
VEAKSFLTSVDSGEYGSKTVCVCSQLELSPWCRGLVAKMAVAQLVSNVWIAKVHCRIQAYGSFQVRGTFNRMKQ